MPTPEASIGPMVDPHPMSFLTTNSYIGRLWIFPTSLKRRDVIPLVA
ncbi:hypothetical protein MtrunA17_Chr1g0198501 [Medicago truncatula]|uniref:Uncharacterized protein n=1 Tax=Medicago truncatula TaxID=3880 RepID=A0A396JYX3_MEDTR|nr:hypothetical protein MtrunA17_Chr1g0198501 [Medicago truncatula]